MDDISSFNKRELDSSSTNLNQREQRNGSFNNEKQNRESMKLHTIPIERELGRWTSERLHK